MKLTACLAAVAAVCLVPVAALADASTTVSAQPLWDIIEPQLVNLFALVTMGVITWATVSIGALIKQKTGVDITTGLLAQETAHRDALQSALTNAAGSVLQKVGTQVDIRTLDVKSPEIVAAVNQVVAAVPDALDKFGLTAEDLAPKILAKLPQVAPAPAAPTVVNVAPVAAT